MDRAFSTVHHRCFFPHIMLQSGFNYADLPFGMSYYRLLRKMLFRINVSIKKIKTPVGGDLMFIYVFVVTHTRVLQKMCNSAP